MRKSFLIVIALIIAYVLSHCSNNKKIKNEPSKPKKAKLTLQQSFENGLNNIDSFSDICIKNLPYSDTIIKFLKANNYTPVLLNYLKKDNNKKQIFNLFKLAQENGYQKEFYNYQVIRNSLDSVELMQNVAKHSVIAEIYLASAMLQIYKDLKSSRTNPYRIGGYSFEIKGVKTFYFKDLLIDNPSKISAKIMAQKFSNDNYDVLKKELNKLLNLHGKFTSYTENISPKGFKTIKIGSVDSSGSINLIKNWLAYKGKSNTFKFNKTLKYDTAFVKKINQLQKVYKLKKDSSIRLNLIQNLNKSIRFRIKKISLNMERLRWYSIKKKPGSIFVNVAANELWAFKDDSLKLHFRTCSGKRRSGSYYSKLAKYKETNEFYDRPMNRETPEMSARLAYMVINPTWNIPRNIIVREMWNKMKKDSTYLSRNDYAVYYKGELKRSESINWNKIDPLKNPYKIVQMPGKSNALGRVKFIFANKHSIYLHDTKNKSAFRRSYRNVSHGCVRLEKPMELLHFMDNFELSQTLDDVRIFMGEKPLEKEKLKEYNMMKADSNMMELLEPIPNFKLRIKNKVFIYITYFTCYPRIYTEEEKTKKKSKKPQINYYGDPYKKDGILYKAMWK